MSHQAAIWDRPTRIFHWLIVCGILLNLFVLESGDPPHRWVGYAAVGLVFARFIWGFYGAPASRFANWPLSWRAFREFVGEQRAGRLRDYPGHNPAAALVYGLIWVDIAALAISGWMMGLDAFWGEEWLEETHEAFSIALQVLIVLHLLGLAFNSRQFRRKTWLGMVTGRRS